MKNQKNIKKNKLAFWAIPISAAFLIFVLGFAYQAIAQQVGLTIGYVESGSADLNMTASTQNLFYGLVDVNSTVSDAGFLLLEKGSTNQMFKVDISGRIKSAANMALGGAALSETHVLNTTGSINTTGGFCINDDCKTNWGEVTGTNYWIQSGSNLYASSTAWNVGIGTTGPVSKLDVMDGDISLTYTGMAHGITSWAPTNAFGAIQNYGSLGGLELTGISTTASVPGTTIDGIIGVLNPTDTTAAIHLRAGKKGTGTDAAALGNAETVFKLTNYTTDLVTVLGNGSVGIGTTNPVSALQVDTSGASTIRIQTGVTTLGQTANLEFGISTNDAITASKISAIRTDIGGANSADLAFFTSLGVNSNERMRILANGNIGIATTTPDFRLTLGTPSPASYTMSAGNYRIGNVMDPNLASDAATKGYVDTTVQGYSVPSGSGDFGYWNLNNSVISNRSAISASVGVNTGGTSISGVSFAVAQGQSGSGTASFSTTTGKITGCGGTNFYNTFKEGDLFKPEGIATTTVIWVSSTTEEMITAPLYSSSFSCRTYNVASVPVGGTPIFVVKGSGQIGIGTVAPAASLHISSAGTNEVSDKAIIVGDASSSIAFAVSRLGKVTIGTSTAEEMLSIGAGKIYLGDVGEAGTGNDNRLYSVAGKLYWGDEPVGAGATTTWSLSGNNLFASSTAYNVAIGTTTAGVYKLNVVGNSYFNGDLTNTGKLYHSLGTAALPSLTFIGDVDTGIYSPGADQVAASTNGTLRLTVSTTQFTGTLPWRGQAGSAGAPAFSFSADTNTGIYGGSDALSLSTGGVARLTLSTSNFSSTLPWLAPDGLPATPSFSFVNDPNTGIYLFSADTLAFATNGNKRMDLSSLGVVNIASADTAAISINSKAILGLANNSAITSAVNKDYVDTLFGDSADVFLALAGGTMSGSIAMGGNDITGADGISANKLDVLTIDPPYFIDGIRYSTYAASFAGGVKEEYSGQAKITKKNSLGEYEYVVDFDKLRVGDDLWLWRQIIDFSRDNVEVVITPYGSFASVYYLIDDNKLIFRADKKTDISYRLTGRRFDWRDWPTKSLDQNNKWGMFIR